LKGYQEQGLLPEHAHTNAWKLTLAIEVAGRLGAMDRAWSRKTEDAIRTLRRFVTDNFGNLEPGLLKTASGPVKGLTSFNLSAFGFSVGVDREKGTPVPITPAVIQALWDTLRHPLSEQSILVEFDRLDDSWDGSDQSRSLLIGLLKAAKDVNDESEAKASEARSTNPSGLWPEAVG
jgi:hypothetical protein